MFKTDSLIKEIYSEDIHQQDLVGYFRIYAFLNSAGKMIITIRRVRTRDDESDASLLKCFEDNEGILEARQWLKNYIEVESVMKQS